MSRDWPLVALGNAVTRLSRPVCVEPLAEYPLLGIRLDGSGPFLRETKKGSQLSARTLFRVSTGDFIYSRLFAWRGAFGVVPPALDGCFVSNEFPTFAARDNQIDVRFLSYWFRLPSVLQRVEADCTGSTPLTRNRYKEGPFLHLEVPLPPLPEQRRIVSRLEELATMIRECRSLRRASTAATKAVVNSRRNAVFGEEIGRHWVSVGAAVLDIENGWSPACHAYPAAEDRWGVIKVGAVSFGEFDPTDNKELPQTLAPRPEHEIRVGDVLFSRANTTELVGACALVRETRPRLMLSDKVFRFVLHPGGRVEPAYLNHVLKSPGLRRQIQDGATGTSPTMKNISKAKILGLRIPLPPAEQQRRIVGHLDQLEGKVRGTQGFQAMTSRNLDTLLPSILDKAFKGQL